MSQAVLVVIGVGGMGIACAKRLGSGRKLLLADISESTLAKEQAILKVEGFVVETSVVDVCDIESVQKLASRANELGKLEIVLHTAGLSPSMASTSKIHEVDLLGTANVIEAFLPVASSNMSLVCIASMAAHFCIDMVSKELQQHLTHAPLASLLDHQDLKENQHPGIAYGIAKRGNQLRVTAAARAYGEKGARINSISPGVIMTPMQALEIQGESGEIMRGMVERSATQRYGTPFDIANAAAFLCSPEASFITGTDLLVDGGAYGAAITTK